ncbi:MAG: hypothetical protein MUC83_11885 [Pirellula sp.]|nr:hypothetical protein [Pirellula sp.]
MNVWKFSLCFMLATCCCVGPVSYGQEGPGGPGGGGGSGGGGGTGGGSGPGTANAPVCYVEKKLNCMEVAANLLASDLQPLKIFCGYCYKRVDNVWECPNAPGTAIYPTPGNPDPNVEKPIPYAAKRPDIPGANLPGKKEITELPEVNCGEIRSCTGCPSIIEPGLQPYCTTSSDGNPWMIKPRQLAGEQCQTSEG